MNFGLIFSIVCALAGIYIVSIELGNKFGIYIGFLSGIGMTVFISIVAISVAGIWNKLLH